MIPGVGKRPLTETLPPAPPAQRRLRRVMTLSKAPIAEEGEVHNSVIDPQRGTVPPAEAEPVVGSPPRGFVD